MSCDMAPPFCYNYRETLLAGKQAGLACTGQPSTETEMKTYLLASCILILAAAAASIAEEPTAAQAGEPLKVVLTFDDGSKEHATLAAPLLAEYGYQATFNIITDRIGVSTNSLTWGQVRELAKAGHEIASHTCTHRNLNTLIADGADGFRYDTAKHIGLPDDPADDEKAPNNFWERVTGEITDGDRIFNYGEVLQGDNDRLADYIAAIGHTTASDYGKYIRMCASEGMLIADKLSDLQTGGSTDVVTWVESHDNYTDKTSVLLTDEQIVRGWSIIAASGLGTPLFFDRPLGSSYAEQFGKMNRIGAAGSPLYKDRTVAAVNRFRNAMTGTETLMSNPEGSAKVLLISRGSKGAVLVSGLKEDTEVSMPCYLPDGTYPDRSGNNPDLTVSGGVLSGTLRAGSTAVLYNEGYTEPVKMPEVSLETDGFAVYGDTAEVTLHVRGAGSGSFTLNGVTEPFTDGEKRTVTISGDECSVTLSAENSDGFASRMTYWFTKLRPAAAGDTISFVKPEDWNGDIYVYIYDETVHPMVKNAVWPGEAMTPVGDGSYTYTLPTDLGAALVIFSDSSGRQYPAAMEPGVDLEPGKEYTLP